MFSNDGKTSDFVEGGLCKETQRSASNLFDIGSGDPCATHLDRLEIRSHLDDGESLVHLFRDCLKLNSSLGIPHGCDDMIERTLFEKRHDSVEAHSIGSVGSLKREKKRKQKASESDTSLSLRMKFRTKSDGAEGLTLTR